MMNRKERNIQTFAAKNEEDKPKIGLYIVRKCAENIPQKAKWDTPKAKWDIPNGGLGHRGMDNEVE